jgi:chromate reductase, NAD(P)H dehydrogenase (quinone)
MVAKALVTLAPAGPQPEIVEIGHLPFYNQDQDDEGAPPAWVAFRETVKAADAVRS